MMDIVDFHSHILPKADHGSDSVETSIAQLDLAYCAGVRRIICTPHFYPHKHNVDGFIARRDRAYNNLLPHIKEGMELRLGAEALICPGFENLPGIERLFIFGTSTLLIELPSSGVDESYYYTVSEMASRGIDLILAHAERYEPEVVERMLKCGVRLQLNGEAFSSIFLSRRIKKWIGEGRVCAIGSDIHKKDKKAYSSFVKAISRLRDYSERVKVATDEIWNTSKIYK